MRRLEESLYTGDRKTSAVLSEFATSSRSSGESRSNRKQRVPLKLHPILKV
jgi:hypothetical protein